MTDLMLRGERLAAFAKIMLEEAVRIEVAMANGEATQDDIEDVLTELQGRVMAKRKKKAPKVPDALPRCLELLQMTGEYADAVERLSTDKASGLLASLVKDNVAEVLYHLEDMAKAKA